jgi:hypothetical protein
MIRSRYCKVVGQLRQEVDSFNDGRNGCGTSTGCTGRGGAPAGDEGRDARRFKLEEGTCCTHLRGDKDRGDEDMCIQDATL